MDYTPDQKRAIDCVLAIFETGRVPTSASYATCTILADGAGISYGKHQCTDKAGSLDLVVKAYIKKGGKHAKELEACLPLLASNASTKVPPKGPWGPEVTRRSTSTRATSSLMDSPGKPVSAHRTRRRRMKKRVWAEG